jgi:hypothetical protein
MRYTKKEDGKFHIKGKKYDLLDGSRAQVWHGTAYKTTGGLVKDDLTKNKFNRIVSKKKSKTAKKDKRLEKHGYLAKKGHFGTKKSGYFKKFKQNITNKFTQEFK